MSRDEMLNRLGLSDADLTDLLTQYNDFVGKLKPGQQAVIKRSLPTVQEATQSFGPDVTADDMQELFDPNGTGGMFSMYIAVVSTGHKP